MRLALGALGVAVTVALGVAVALALRVAVALALRVAVALALRVAVALALGLAVALAGWLTLIATTRLGAARACFGALALRATVPLVIAALGAGGHHTVTEGQRGERGRKEQWHAETQQEPVQQDGHGACRDAVDDRSPDELSE
jgi:hypothetical protein